MALNNYLEASLPDGNTVLIQFRWGSLREVRYEMGETISWQHAERPNAAEGAIEVPGTAAGGKFFAITVSKDVIAGFREIDAERFEALRRQLKDCH